MAAATGWPDGSPVLVGGAGDPIAGLHATFASLVALCAREEHGRGYLVEATMVEAALNAAAMSAIAYQLSGRAYGRLGNRSGDGLGSPGGVRVRGNRPVDRTGGPERRAVDVAVRHHRRCRPSSATVPLHGETAGGQGGEPGRAGPMVGGLRRGTGTQATWPSGWCAPGSRPQWSSSRPWSSRTRRSATVASSRRKITRSRRVTTTGPSLLPVGDRVVDPHLGAGPRPAQRRDLARTRRRRGRAGTAAPNSG